MLIRARFSLLFLILIARPLCAQEDEPDTTSLSDAVSTFFGFSQPKPGILSQVSAEVSDDESDTRSEIVLRNLRFYITGKAGEKFSYYFQGNINGKYELLDLRMSYQISRIFSIDGGRMKTPFGIEYPRNDGRLMFVHRSMTAVNIGPLRQYGLQLQTRIFDRRISLITGLFNGGPDGTPKISLAVGKLNTVLVSGQVGGSDLRIELGGSAGYTQREADLPEYIFIKRDHLLYGLHTRMAYGPLWLEGEYGAASSDNRKTIEGFYCDLGYRFGQGWETAVRLDWMERYSVLYSPIMSRDIMRKYIIGANWYPLANVKIQFNVEREAGISDIHTVYINVQYAINYE